MNEETGKIERDLTLTEDLNLRGMVVGTLTVPGAVELALDGTVTEDLVVELNGKATIRGTVTGAVINRGGEVEVYGTVGSIRDEAGTTFVDPNAVVRR